MTSPEQLTARRAFDRFYPGLGLTLVDAERWMAKQLGLGDDVAHIGQLSITQATRLTAAIERTLARMRPVCRLRGDCPFPNCTPGTPGCHRYVTAPGRSFTPQSLKKHLKTIRRPLREGGLDNQHDDDNER